MSATRQKNDPQYRHQLTPDQVLAAFTNRRHHLALGLSSTFDSSFRGLPHGAVSEVCARSIGGKSFLCQQAVVAALQSGQHRRIVYCHPACADPSAFCFARICRKRQVDASVLDNVSLLACSDAQFLLHAIADITASQCSSPPAITMLVIDGVNALPTATTRNDACAIAEELERALWRFAAAESGGAIVLVASHTWSSPNSNKFYGRASGWRARPEAMLRLSKAKVDDDDCEVQVYEGHEPVKRVRIALKM